VKHRIPGLLAVGTFIAGCLLGGASAQAQFFQQAKLIGTGAIGPSGQGSSVALSASGSTAIVGGTVDNNGLGAAWVFKRSGGVWTQQAKLVGTGAIGPSGQGFSVALSADGNTAIVSGPGDNSGLGAAWVFKRSGGVWTQQAKLVATGAIGDPVSLSASGYTAIVGGPGDNSGFGAAWVFKRSGGVWTQQAKLVGTGAIGDAHQGSSVALSASGDTAIVGGRSDNAKFGAAWVFKRSSGVWTQQAKLVGTGAYYAEQGRSVALSASGSTAIVGGQADNLGVGAAWAFKRSGGVWTQQAKLVGTDVPSGDAAQGSSVALSASGSTAMVGGPFDNYDVGAAWVFKRSGGVWTQQAKLVGTGAIGDALQGNSVSLSASGSTAIVGGPYDDQAGAAWIYVSFTGIPGTASCHGQSVSALAQQYGGFGSAAAALGYSSVQAMQNGVAIYCAG
jgi:hypothetical protein